MHIFPSGQEGQHRSRPPLLRFCKVLYLSLIVPLTLMSCLPSKRSACSRANKHQRSLHRCWRCSQSARNNKADVQRCLRSTLSSSCICVWRSVWWQPWWAWCFFLRSAHIQMVYTTKMGWSQNKNENINQSTHIAQKHTVNTGAL